MHSWKKENRLFDKVYSLTQKILITFFSFLGITISFCSQLIIGYYFGATAERDAYFVAITIPTYLSAIFIGSVGIIFLPKIVSILNNKPSESINFLSSIFWMLTLILFSYWNFIFK